MPRVVTCLLEHDGKILLLRRSKIVGTYRGLWGGVAGFVEENEDPYKTAIKEIKEEVGIDNDDFRLIKRGDPVSFIDVYEGKEYDWTVFPFLFTIESKNKIKIDWEHSCYEWIIPSDIENYDTVPRLKEIVLKFFK
jgi:8-oxo-dGTP pyrophosphatase MutT (NUDIX family)